MVLAALAAPSWSSPAPPVSSVGSVGSVVPVDSARAAAPPSPVGDTVDIPVLGGTTPERCPDGQGWVATTTTPACVRVGLRRPAGDVSALFVFLHGDGNPVALDTPLLRQLRRVDARAATAALVRPGYTDREGRQTTAVTTPYPGDSYRREDALALGEAIALLRARTGAPRAVLIGHSGGAALAASIAALFPGLLDHVVAASCPCDLAAWRAHQAKVRNSRAWFRPYRSLSPHALAEDIPPTTTVTLLVGERDDNTPPWLHTGYADLVRAAGGSARVLVVPDAGHEVLRAPDVVALVAAVVTDAPDLDARLAGRGVSVLP
jgi:pimeloyl-ACP methyl ester carboxylesterase